MARGREVKEERTAEDCLDSGKKLICDKEQKRKEVRQQKVCILAKGNRLQQKKEV
jgi:hypothetical protein